MNLNFKSTTSFYQLTSNNFSVLNSPTGKSCGYTTSELLSCYDSEGNVPLHSAVHAGDIKAVEICLEYGSNISSQQHDLSTPLHLACSQGAIEIVKLMLNNSLQDKLSLLTIPDAQQMTPIHCLYF